MRVGFWSDGRPRSLLLAGPVWPCVFTGGARADAPQEVDAVSPRPGVGTDEPANGRAPAVLARDEPLRDVAVGL